MIVSTARAIRRDRQGSRRCLRPESWPWSMSSSPFHRTVRTGRHRALRQPSASFCSTGGRLGTPLRSTPASASSARKASCWIDTRRRSVQPEAPVHVPAGLTAPKGASRAAQTSYQFIPRCSPNEHTFVDANCTLVPYQCHRAYAITPLHRTFRTPFV
jgi:hypothetical protein